MLRRWPLPTLIGLLFANLWGLVGAVAFPQPWSLISAAAVVLTTAALFVRSLKVASLGNGLLHRNAYRLAVVAELIGIALAQVITYKLGLQLYFICTVGFIVGLHFIGLWLASSSKRFLWISVGMCAVSLLSTALPSSTMGLNPRTATVGLGNAIVLWAGAAL